MSKQPESKSDPIPSLESVVSAISAAVSTKEEDEYEQICQMFDAAHTIDQDDLLWFLCFNRNPELKKLGNSLQERRDEQRRRGQWPDETPVMWEYVYRFGYQPRPTQPVPKQRYGLCVETEMNKPKVSALSMQSPAQSAKPKQPGPSRPTSNATSKNDCQIL